MATLVLTAVGAVVGGPFGASIGALVGEQIDRTLFAPKARQGPRLGDLTVQTSSYGTQIPKIYGTMRVAGTVIWATDLKEQRGTSGGKGQPQTVGYSYSVSFAVAVCGRRIRAVRRIWADGKLLRGAAGDFKTQTGYRLYLGTEDQDVDPAIASAEGAGQAPAHRGIAYAVFEDFQLAGYGNHIPSLTFEVEAEAAPVAIGDIAASLSGNQIRAGPTPFVSGYAASGDSIRAAIEALADVVPLSLAEDEGELVLQAEGQATAVIVQADTGAKGARGSGGRTESSRVSAAAVAAEVAISYHDEARDYQTGLQRARRGGPALKQDRRALPAVLSADQAKGFAERRLASLWAGREALKLHLPWRALKIGPGAIVTVDGQSGLWRVKRRSLEEMVVCLELARLAGRSLQASGGASPGRPLPQKDVLHGPTTLFLIELPSMTDQPATRPQLAAVAGGAEAGWRSAALVMSLDGGSSWNPHGQTAPEAVIGKVEAALGAGGSALFDERNSLVVELLNDEAWLESRSDAALAGGANLASVGEELLQFGRSEPLGARRFRLSRLLRGRRGTEWAASTHSSGEAFALLDPATMLLVDNGAAMSGSEIRLAPQGIGDPGDALPVVRTIEGRALQPPAPVHLRAETLAGGDLLIRWTRRSRIGWNWPSGSDTPLGEEREAYQVELSGVSFTRRIILDVPEYRYPLPVQESDGWSGALRIAVVQVGTFAASRPATLLIER